MSARKPASRLKLRLARMVGPFARIREDEDGNATVEFVILFPVFIVVFCSTFELGLLMTRHVMLERGLDFAVRAIRLGTNNPGPVTAEQVRTMICNSAGIIPDCMNQVKVEMQQIDPRAWTNIPARADCVDRNQPATPDRGVSDNFATGGSHEMMILRVCALINPFFPTTGLGATLKTHHGEAYALVATSAFVMEP